MGNYFGISHFQHSRSLIQQKTHGPIFTPNYSTLPSLPLKLPLASLMRDPCSPQVPMRVSLPVPNKLPRFWKGEKAPPPFHFHLIIKCLKFCGSLRSLCSPHQRRTAEKRQARCYVQDAHGPPASRAFAGLEGAGRGGPGQRQGPAPIAAPGAWRGGGGTAAQASEVCAGRRAPPARALAEPRLPAPPWRRPRGAPRPCSPARAGRAPGLCRLHAPHGSSSSSDLSPCFATESPGAAPPPAVSSETFPGGRLPLSAPSRASSQRLPQELAPGRGASDSGP